MATLRKAKASLLALIFLVDIVSFSGLVAARPIAMDQPDIEGYHENTIPGSTTLENAWTGNSFAEAVGSGITVTPSSETESAGIPAGSSTDGAAGSWGSDSGTDDTGYENGSPSTLPASGRSSTPNTAADSTSSEASESTKRSTTTEPVTGGGNSNNGVNGGATNTGSGTNVNVITSPANGAEKEKGLVDTLLGKLGSIVKTLR